MATVDRLLLAVRQGDMMSAFILADLLEEEGAPEATFVRISVDACARCVVSLYRKDWSREPQWTCWQACAAWVAEMRSSVLERVDGGDVPHISWFDLWTINRDAIAALADRLTPTTKEDCRS